MWPFRKKKANTSSGPTSPTGSDDCTVFILTKDGKQRVGIRMECEGTVINCHFSAKGAKEFIADFHAKAKTLPGYAPPRDWLTVFDELEKVEEKAAER